ncbi:uncharacterized protein LOC9650432 [Selaginella moellendorffii]|uniref:uncharacterized protein LOC9650432 n=1 Tax=Selaginella moellendorffii TaxID=88036 RepID=UPI000D1CE725|nr:uncharacterized protein LOC9650432 [Selaginella moellendorffii]|eukprot:XP_024518836.1 uncharacterized protein LOC9650432 [Selaginella moellendorffii]
MYSFADGSLGLGTALFHQHYEDDPNNFGLCVADLSWLSESVSAASELKLQVEHAQHLSPGAHLKFGKFSISVSMQPEKLLDDAYYAMKKLGEKHSRRSYNLRSLVGNGSVVALGSNWPVSLSNTFSSALRECPCFWIHTYTSSAVYAAALEDLVGSLMPGKFADFVVLPESPFGQGTGIFPRVVTFVGGNIAFLS